MEVSARRCPARAIVFASPDGARLGCRGCDESWPLLGAAGLPAPPRAPYRGFFDPMRTTSARRPCRRRRLRVSRPALVFMRARKPCLFTRLRLRGLYVGFISSVPVSLAAASGPKKAMGGATGVVERRKLPAPVFRGQPQAAKRIGRTSFRRLTHDRPATPCRV